MSDPERAEVLGVLVTHGAMASALVDTVRRITGVAEGALVPLSNDGKGPDELQAEILALVGDGPALVLTDLNAGSCMLAARLTCRDCKHVALVTGVNLPMLLDFVFHRSLPTDELAQRLVEKGRAGMLCLTPTGADVDPSLSR